MSNRRKLARGKIPATGMVAAQLKLAGADRRLKRANRRTVPVIAVLDAIDQANATTNGS